MVRPNQIINRAGRKLTFIMFARSESQVSRRVLLLNFPGAYMKQVLFGDKSPADFITNVDTLTEGRVNRYAVTIDTSALS